MWAAGGLMRDVCLPKFPKITKEIADGIRAGNLPNEKDAKCYVNCILEMMQTVSALNQKQFTLYDFNIFKIIDEKGQIPVRGFIETS